VVLGYGSNANPAGELVPALRRAREIAAQHGRNLAFVGHVCGTEGDPQGLDLQTNALTQAGMVLTQSNAQAVRLAASMVAGRAPGR
jgi:FdrA protein